MKKIITGLALGWVLAFSAGAQIIAQWNFEGLTATNTGVSPIASLGSLSADVGSGTASALHASASTVWSEPVGNGTAKSLSSNNWSVGDYYQFQVSTAGFSSIFLAWSQQGSATGPKNFTLQYSTDGSSFTDFTTYSVVVASPSWSSSAYNSNTVYYEDLSAISAINNFATVYFRITDNSTTPISSGTTVGTGGTDRVDQFTVSQGFQDITVVPVPEPHEYAMAIASLLGAVVLMRRRSKMRNVTT